MTTQPPDAMDLRICFGIQCRWWDCGTRSGLRENDGTIYACCPYCGGQIGWATDWEAFMKPALDFEQAGHPGYIAGLIERRGWCTHTPKVYRGDRGYYWPGEDQRGGDDLVYPMDTCEQLDTLTAQWPHIESTIALIGKYRVRDTVTRLYTTYIDDLQERVAAEDH